ncbi:hypothetical protein ACL7TT_13630 [Microbulbifer sp. 2304DJ12-6]|uniref:hypothetical protein n=1 Tax=Microbulbifer sp. 2304DJ12-6 TaxID=3233340 RepID=UPI0039AEDDEC
MTKMHLLTTGLLLCLSMVCFAQQTLPPQLYLKHHHIIPKPEGTVTYHGNKPVFKNSRVDYQSTQIISDSHGCKIKILRLSPKIAEKRCANSKPYTSLLFGPQSERSFQLAPGQYLSNSGARFVYLSDGTVLSRKTGDTVKPPLSGNLKRLVNTSKKIYWPGKDRLLFYRLFGEKKLRGWYQYDYRQRQWQHLAKIETHRRGIWFGIPRVVDSMVLIDDQWLVALESDNFRGDTWLDISLYHAETMELIQRIRLEKGGTPGVKVLEVFGENQLVAAYYLGGTYHLRVFELK